MKCWLTVHVTCIIALEEILQGTLLINNHEGKKKKIPYSPQGVCVFGTKAQGETDKIIKVTRTPGSDQLMIKHCG